MAQYTATALLVEDEALLRSMYSSVLSELGYNVTEAVRADAALEVFKHAGPFDLLLSDIRTGGAIDGFQLAQEVAANTSQTRVILMSGEENDQTSSNSFDFLLKPFTLTSLSALVDLH